MTTQTAGDVSLVLLSAEGFVACVGHANTPPHPAEWYAHCPCHHNPIPVCEGRRALAEKLDGWNCGGRGGCGAWHNFGYLGFWRI